MLGLLNFRNYTFIALIVGGIMGAIYYFDTGRGFANYVSGLGSSAAGSLGTTVAGFVTTPIVWAATDPLGAAAAGLLWPLAAIWLILFVAMFVFNIFAPFFNSLLSIG